MRDDPSYPTFDNPMEQRGFDLAYESGLNLDVFSNEAREHIVAAAKDADDSAAALQGKAAGLSLEIARQEAEHASANTRVVLDDLAPHYSRETRAVGLTAQADQAQRELKRPRVIHLALVFGFIYMFVFYVSVTSTAFNFGEVIETASSSTRLRALMGSILRPEAVQDALHGNLTALLFPLVPITLAFSLDRARRRRALCLLLVSATIAIDCLLAFAVVRALHTTAVLAGIKPAAPFAFTDALRDWAFYLTLVMGLGAAMLLALVNHFWREQERAEEAGVQALRSKAAELRAAREYDKELLVLAPERLRNLHAQLDVTTKQLQSSGRIDAKGLDIKLRAILRGWIACASKLHATDKDRLREVQAEAEQALREIQQKLSAAFKRQNELLPS